MNRLVVVFLGTAAPIASAGSQAVVGQILKRPSGTPIPNAQVVLVDVGGRPKATVISDSVGRYAIQAPASGKYRVLAAASGFEPANTAELSLEPGQLMPLDLKLSLAQPATQLEAVTVTATKPVVAAPPGNPHKYDDFLMRRKMGIGTFLTREQIEGKPVTQTPQLFSQIPGLKVRQRGTEWFIQSQRCPAKLGASGAPQDMDRDDPTLFPILFVDGFRVRGLKFITSISPSQIEAIEVYQGSAQLPADAKGDACAAIYIWLRNGSVTR